MEANKIVIFGLLLAVGASAFSEQTFEAHETEMFSIPISPNMFNWTYQEFDQQYRFHASLLGKPELPPWLRYIYSGRHHSGFIYGTPPHGTKPLVILEVVGLNRADYETRRVSLRVRITPRASLATHEALLKVDNLNVEDLLDEHRMSRLKEIFREKLWKESADDLYCTFLASAVDLGARLPLRPNEGEGLVVRVGSAAPISAELARVREEVRPLSRLQHCPRGYKRTTVERLFRQARLALDWCSFELYKTVYTARGAELVPYLSAAGAGAAEGGRPDGAPGRWSAAGRWSARGRWSAPGRGSLPCRGWRRELAAAAAAPALLLLLAAAAATAALCVHYAPVEDSESEHFFQNIFHICIDFRRHRAQKTGTVELCRYETNNTEQTQVNEDNNSSKSLGASPNNSLARPYSPKSSTNLAGNYNRPQPPPYGPSASSLHRRKPGNTENIDSRALALEQSLQLLNEAKIGGNFDVSEKNPIVDSNDGCDDYVPIKGEFLSADLDDINVPELSKYGLGVSIPDM